MLLPRVALALLLFIGSTARGSAASPWLEVDSDLPPHPALTQGTLPNGLRYLILPNATPKDRVSLRLLIAVGSLHEQDDETGLAHFVEHMAFRGTRTHPAGSLTAALQRLGMGFGPDSAAFTSYEHTIYHLELPDATEATLRDGLQVFREYAEEVTFDEKAIERERGVILSESATRDTPQARSVDANQTFLWPTSRHVQRPVIGHAAAVRRFTREQFVAFYDAWYRPERMAVIIVGNVDAATAAPLVGQTLGRLAARGPARPEPELVPAEAVRPDVEIFADPGLLGVALTLERPVATPRGRDTQARRAEMLHEALAFAMLHQRLQKIAHEPGTSFIAPLAQLTPALRGWRLATIGVAGKLDDWKLVAADVEQEHRRAFQFGFTAHELQMARAAFAASYEQAVRTAPTWPSDWLAGHLAGNVLNGAVFARPEDVQRDIAAALERTTVDDCLRAFRRLWSVAAPHVFISANPSFQITRRQIADVLNESRAREVTRREETTAVAFAYDDFGPPGRLAREERVADLDLRLSEFENGVRFNFKATAFEADTVEIHLRVGDGKLSQPEDRPGLDVLANFALTAGGLGRHTTQELTGVLAGRSIGLHFNVGSDACTFRGRCARRDLSLTLQIIGAFLTDARYRPELMRDARAAFATMYASLAASPSGEISLVALRELAGGDRRFGVAGVDDLFSRNLDELKPWLEPQLKRGAIELSIVGETTWEEALDAVSRTLAALPKRDARAAAVHGSAIHPRPPVNPKVLTGSSALKQAAVAWYWPVPALASIPEERRCRLLAHVLHERVRVRLREELGATYSPVALFDETSGFPHLSHFMVYAEIAPAHLQRAMNVIQREAMALTLRGVEADEFTRVKQPFLRARADDIRTNAYWGATVLGDAQERPQRLAAARDRARDTAAITVEEVNALAKRHLDPAKSFRFATVPATPAPPRGPPASAAAKDTAAHPR